MTIGETCLSQKTKREEKKQKKIINNDSVRAQTPTAFLFENFFIAKILFSVDLKMRLNFAKIMSIPNFSDIYALNVYLQALVLRAPHLFPRTLCPMSSN